MTKAQEQQLKRLKLWKVIGLTIFWFLLGNYIFETIIEIIESHVYISLYEIFPYTRIALLVVAILIARSYWIKQGSKKKKKDSKLKKGLKITGMSIVGIVVFLGILGGIKEPFNTALYEKNMKAEKHLKDNRELAQKCKETLGMGLIEVMATTTDLITPDSVSLEQMNKLTEAEKKYTKILKDKCEPVVRDYESSFKEYKRTATELYKLDTPLILRAVGVENEIDPMYFYDYDPQTVYIEGISNGFIFTKQEAESYLKSQAGL